MTYVRQNAWTISKNEGTWADTFTWYARGVADMQQRALTDLTSWRFYAAIHGFRKDKWSAFGYFREGETLPRDSDVNRYWRQCQHGTWYFLPWHRGYLLTFEAIARASIVRLGGPNTWALPYWNYFADGEADIPPAFASRTLPDGTVNPLYVQARYGPNNDGNVSIPMDQVSLDPLSDDIFVGTFNHGATGFGGPITRFSHSGGYHGGLETQPHDMVHVCIGGFPPQAGLMSDPVTAALDPIFWLHHANIDRLWEIWLNNSTAHSNPTDSHWLGGPATYGDQKFSTPDGNGAPYDYTPATVVDLSALGYRYDDLSSPVPPVASLRDRIQQLGGSTSRIENLAQGEVMSRLTEPELVGTNRRSISIAGSDPTVTEVSVSRTPRKQLSMTLNQAMSASLPDRVFLNLENVTGLSDGSRFKVLISDPAANRSDAYIAGTIGLFGVSTASEADGKHTGQGVSYSFDITKFVDSLQVQNELNADQLHVTIVPLVPVPEKAQIRVGRVSIYRQPQSLIE